MSNKTLIYCGTHQGTSLSRMISKFDRCIGFEADPELYKICSDKFKEHKHVTIIHGALTTFDGEVSFSICDKKVCNSIGTKIHEDFRLDLIPFSFIKQIKVPAINLCAFLIKNKIDHIDRYVSDLQGMDFEVLNTLKPLLDARKINKITCEICVENKKLYPDLPNNYKGQFDQLLGSNYKLIRTARAPGKWKWWADCTWKVKGG